MAITSEISVENHVRAYLLKRYGKEPFRFTKTDHIGKNFYSIVNDQSTEHDADLFRKKLKPYPAFVMVEISENLYLKNGLLYTETGIREFNNYVSEHIYEILFTTMDFTQEFMGQKKYKYNEALMKFCELQGLDEDNFQYERIKKAWYRHRMRANGL